jgi:hypothetical protein
LTATVSMAVISGNHPIAGLSNSFLNSLMERVSYPSGGTCWTSATGTSNPVLLGTAINNNEGTHGDCIRVRTIITNVQSTLEVLGSIYWGPCIILSEQYKLAVNKLVSSSVRKVKYSKVSPTKPKGQSNLKLPLTSYFFHSRSILIRPPSRIMLVRPSIATHTYIAGIHQHPNAQYDQSLLYQQHWCPHPLQLRQKNLSKSHLSAFLD